VGGGWVGGRGGGQHAKAPAEFHDGTKLESVMRGEETLPPMQL
jgi:hypothetical protein